VSHHTLDWHQGQPSIGQTSQSSSISAEQVSRTELWIIFPKLSCDSDPGLAGSLLYRIWSENSSSELRSLVVTLVHESFLEYFRARNTWINTYYNNLFIFLLKRSYMCINKCTLRGLPETDLFKELQPTIIKFWTIQRYFIG
jgi:hypothetical protein